MKTFWPYTLSSFHSFCFHLWSRANFHATAPECDDGFILRTFHHHQATPDRFGTIHFPSSAASVRERARSISLRARANLNNSAAPEDKWCGRIKFHAAMLASFLPAATFQMPIHTLHPAESFCVSSQKPLCWWLGVRVRAHTLIWTQLGARAPWNLHNKGMRVGCNYEFQKDNLCARARSESWDFCKLGAHLSVTWYIL